MESVVLSRIAKLTVLLGMTHQDNTTVRAEAIMSPIKADERIIFFPTAARLSDEGDSWIVPVHGWIFEPEEDDALRIAALREIRDALDLQSDLPATTILEQRLRPFLVDNERGKHVGIAVAGQTHTLSPSAPEGHFIDTIKLPAAVVDEHRIGNRLAFHAVTTPGDRREFRGVAECVPSKGISVISDIDDTIKVTGVRDPHELVRNTFLREFRAVDGMADLYRQWAVAGAVFHYVSASPWQLYEPLAQFTKTAGFPDAVFHLQRFRLKDSSFRALLVNPIGHKLAIIELLLQNYPERQFILVSDSGEKDPEAYATLARRHGARIAHIYIRNITNESRDAPRYREAFRDVPPEKWQLFDNPQKLLGPIRPE